MMSSLTTSPQTIFEQSKHTDDGMEFWYARELMSLLAYTERRNFLSVIQKAKEACKNNGLIVVDHFVDVNKMIEIGKGGEREVQDIELTRYACYLIAMNGDPRKVEIALAQSYFASQTKKQEEYEQYVEQKKRIEARQKLKDSESKIESTVYKRGISSSIDFASFKDKKIQALYGMTTRQLKTKRKIPNKRALADFDSEVELKAKDFIYAMTDHNIKQKDIIGKDKLTQELVSNAKTTRKALLERGIKPESLPKQPDLKIIQKNNPIGNFD